MWWKMCVLKIVTRTNLLFCQICHKEKWRDQVWLAALLEVLIMWPKSIQLISFIIFDSDKNVEWIWICELNMASDIWADLCGKYDLFRFFQYERLWSLFLRVVRFKPTETRWNLLTLCGFSSSSCCGALNCFPSGFCLIKVGLMNPAGEQRPTPPGGRDGVTEGDVSAL